MARRTAGRRAAVLIAAALALSAAGAAALPDAPAPNATALTEIVTGWVDCVTADCRARNMTCSGPACSVTCGANGCQDSSFVCPQGTLCKFSCDSPGSCFRSSVLCAGLCEVTCPGPLACSQILVPDAWPALCDGGNIGFTTATEATSCEVCAPAAACAKPMAARRKRKRWEDTLQWWDTLLLVLGGVGFVCGILVGVLEGMGCIQCFQKRKKESGTYKYNWETQAYEYTPPGAESIGRATPSASASALALAEGPHGDDRDLKL